MVKGQISKARQRGLILVCGLFALVVLSLAALLAPAGRPALAGFTPSPTPAAYLTPVGVEPGVNWQVFLPVVMK